MIYEPTSHRAPTDDDRPYEWRTFRVGDRVRVRLSGECPVVFKHSVDGNGRVLTLNTPHYPNEDGITGYIATVPFNRIIQGGSHPYYVEFDKPIRADGYWLAGGTFAATELEPLDDATRRIAELANEALALQVAVLLAERDERGEWAMVEEERVAWG